MKGMRHLYIIVGFCTTMVGVSVLGFNSKWKRAYGSNISKKKTAEDIYSNESYFENVNYYALEEYNPSIRFFAAEFSHNALNEKVFFSKPNGIFFSSEGEPVRYEAAQGLWFKNTQTLLLEKDIRLRHHETTVETQKLTYTIPTDNLVATGDVYSVSKNLEGMEEVQVSSDKLYSRPKGDWSKFIGNVKGKIKRKRAYEENVDFGADVVELSLAKQKVDLVDNVSFKKQRFRATSLRGEIFLENYNKKLKYFVLFDDVVVKEKVIIGGSSSNAFQKEYERTAYSDKLEGFMQDRLVKLTGYPKVVQEKDVIKGNVIILREDNEVVEVDDANSNFILR